MSFLTNKALENLLNYSSVKGKVISENIANIGSKDYQRKDVKFKNILDDNMQSFMKVTSGKHMAGSGNVASGSEFEIIADKNDELVSGVNNVDIDREMAEMAENTLRFKFASKKLGRYYKNLQNVIKGD
jgi:flagellar basal-body rod protein FlgB